MLYDKFIIFISFYKREIYNSAKNHIIVAHVVKDIEKAEYAAS